MTRSDMTRSRREDCKHRAPDYGDMIVDWPHNFQESKIRKATHTFIGLDGIIDRPCISFTSSELQIANSK